MSSYDIRLQDFCVLRTDPLRNANRLKKLKTAFQKGGGVTFIFDKAKCYGSNAVYFSHWDLSPQFLVYFSCSFRVMSRTRKCRRTNGHTNRHTNRRLHALSSASINCCSTQNGGLFEKIELIMG